MSRKSILLPLVAAAVVVGPVLSGFAEDGLRCEGVSSPVYLCTPLAFAEDDTAADQLVKKVLVCQQFKEPGSFELVYTMHILTVKDDEPLPGVTVGRRDVSPTITFAGVDRKWGYRYELVKEPKSPPARGNATFLRTAFYQEDQFTFHRDMYCERPSSGGNGRLRAANRGR